MSADNHNLITICYSQPVNSQPSKMSQNACEHSASLRFHPHHGPDIRLSNNNTTAARATPGSGLVFTSHPLQPLQRLTIRLSHISQHTKEIVSVGFTSSHPSQTNETIHSLKIVSLKKHKRLNNRTVHFFYTPAGKIHFGVDGKEKGSREVLRPTHGALWAFVHISSAPTTVDIVNSSFYLSNQGLFPMTLHQTRGRNVKLVNNRVSKYDRRLRTGYAFTAAPMRAGEYVVVKILDLEDRSEGGLVLGLTSCDPSHLEEQLPDDVTALAARPEHWTTVSDPSWVFGAGDRVAFVVTSAGRMRIWRNEATLLKEVKVGVASPLWAFFDVAAVGGVEVLSYTPVDGGGLETLSCEPDWVEVRNDAVVPGRKKGEEEQSLCAVCYEGAVEAALYPCGHMCMCYRCAREQWRGAGRGSCPMCRVKIRDILKIYKI